MRQNPTSATPKNYGLKIATFENGKPEEFLELMKNSKTVIGGTETTSETGSINYIRTVLRG